ncbi:MAG: hypothetical protein N2517_04620 [Ignavibacteria bacterium]|nr:hypothetical protein [Ignavibacteria bacterium]
MTAKGKFRRPEQVPAKRLGVTQVGLFVVLIVVFFFIFFYTVIPWATAEFVVPLFRPSSDKLAKIGFIQFKGLVWASTTKEKAGEIIKQGRIEIAKDLINREFIFDFTFEKRTEEVHGYAKDPDEFYVKSEVIGEHAIILQPWIGFWILALDLAFFAVS